MTYDSEALPKGYINLMCIYVSHFIKLKASELKKFPNYFLKKNRWD